jgi:uncharacterized protein
MGAAMTRSETIATLKASAEEIRKLGATGLYLYGSAARDELSAESDVDLFIDYDPDGAFSFVELVRLQTLIGQKLAREVDLTTRNGLHPLLKAEIERSSIRVL